MSRARNYMLTAEELRLRRRKHRKIVGAVCAVLLLGVFGFFGGRPTLNAIKGWQARRHAQKALAFIEQEKWTDARGEAVAAYQLRPTEPQALRAIAQYLSRVRQQQALDFWKSLREVAMLTREDRRDEATIALISGETERAAAAINELLAADGKDATPADWLLAAQLALQKSEPENAQRNLQKIFGNQTATEREKLQAALLELQGSRSGDNETSSQTHKDAWSRIIELARGKSETALGALMLLAQRRLSSPVGGTGSAPSSFPNSADLSHDIENHPLAKAPQKLVALDLQIYENPAEKDVCIERAIAQWKESDTTSLAALAKWLNGHGEFQRELDMIPLEKSLQTRDLFVQHLDALGALGRWGEIKQLLESERFPIDPVTQRMYLARCYAQLEEKTAAENNWRRALEAAGNDPQKLLTLAEYAEKNGATEIADTAFANATIGAPRLRLAWQGRLRLAEASRDTKKMHAVLTEMLQEWPNDSAIQNDEAYTRLLLIPDEISSGNELIVIEQLAEKLVQREPASLPHRTLLALARLKQHRPAAALEAYANIQLAPNALSPSALAVHAAVLAGNDRWDDARTEIAQAPLDKLLPEEQARTADLRK